MMLLQYRRGHTYPKRWLIAKEWLLGLVAIAFLKEIYFLSAQGTFSEGRAEYKCALCPISLLFLLSETFPQEVYFFQKRWLIAAVVPS